MKCECPKGFPITSWEPLGPEPIITTGAGPRRSWVQGLFRLHTGRCPLCDELMRVRRRR